MDDLHPGCIQIIENADPEEDTLGLSLDKTKFDKWIDVAGLDEFKDSTEYSFVAIMGPQSSGKSTIMNKMFGSDFTVLNAQKRRSQTTQGIWFGRSTKAKNIVAIDLEGTDSAQRKNNRHNVERQTALFALTITEVLIVNMFANQVGLASGMNVDTLKAIIKANLRLFSPDAKTQLVFLVRDQPVDPRMGTPSEIVQETLKKEITGIWDSIDRPEAFEDKEITSIFDIHYIFMPPMLYEPKLFAEAVDDLRMRFTDPKHKKFLFAGEGRYCKSVPTDGLFHYIEQVWEAVYKDEALNIPDQQKLLASWKGSKVVNETMAQFKESLEPIRTELDTGMVTGLGDKLNELLMAGLGSYEANCKGYAQEEVDSKKADLREKMMNELKKIVTKHMEYVHKDLAEAFEMELASGLPKDMCSSDFMNVVAGVLKESWKSFLETFDTVAIKNEDGTPVWKEDEFWDRIKDRLKEVTANLRMLQCDRLEKDAQKLTMRVLCPQAENTFKSSKGNVWDNVSKDRANFHSDSVRNELHKKLDRLGLSKDEGLAVKKRLIRAIDAELLLHMERVSDRFESLLNKRFYGDFGSDGGVPRNWYPGLNIKRLYNDAKIDCFNLLDSFQRAQLREDRSFNPPLPEEGRDLLDNNRIAKLREDFDSASAREFKTAMLEQERRNEANRILPTHPVAWAILLYLGKDEIFWVLTNPFMMFLVILGGIGFFVLTKMQAMGLVGDYRTAAALIFSQASAAVVKVGKDLLEQAQGGAAQRAHPRRGVELADRETKKAK